MRQTVIFDFFGVMCSEIAPQWIHKRLPGEDEKNIHDRLIVPADLGHKPESMLFNELGSLAGMSGEQVLSDWRSLVVIDRGVVELARELRQQGKVGLCSNAWASFLRPILKEHDLENLFDSIVISSEVGQVKPDAGMYRASLDALEAIPEQCIFIDDQTKNIVGAEALGMRGILFTDTQDLKAKLDRAL